MIRRRVSLRWVALLLAVALAVVVASCSPQHPQSTFDPQGPGANQLRDLFSVIFWAAVAVAGVVGFALLYVVLRYRRKADGETPPQVHGHKNLEIAWTIAPAVVLVIIAVPTILAIFDQANTPEPEGMKVRVVAHQWWWEFQYPELGVITANELHVPVGEVVNLTLTSNDVIHSFWIPKLVGKKDVIPGRENTMWFRADTADTFQGQCAEFCGIAHAHMRFRVIAEPQPVFDAWVESQRASIKQPTGLALRGAQTFVNKGCGACHTIRGAPGAVGVIGPDLTHFASRTTFAGAILENDPQARNLTQWLRDPEDVKPGNIMARTAPVYVEPSLALTEDDVSALVAFLQGLR